MFRKLIAIVPAVMLLAIPMLASAHVVVTPATANIGDSVTFTVSVPNEKDTPVTGLKLVIPSGLNELTPTVKPGWTITTTNNGAKDPTITAITWSDGSIPVGLRDDFTFKAQVPAQATQLDWKAYQTYGDGSVVHWDQRPTGSDDDSNDVGPYSVTKVINDLAGATSASKTAGSTTWPLIISLAALVISIGGILFRKK